MPAKLPKGRVPSHAIGPSPVSPVTRQLVAWSVARSFGHSVAFWASDRLIDQASDRMSNRSSKPPARTQSLGLPRLPRVPSHMAVPRDFCRYYQRFPPIAFPFLTFPFPSLSSPTLPSLPFSIPSFPSPFLPSFLPSILRSVLRPPSSASPLWPKVGSAEPRSVNNFDVHRSPSTSPTMAPSVECSLWWYTKKGWCQNRSVARRILSLTLTPP